MLYTPKEEIESRIQKLKTLLDKASIDGAFFHYKIDYYYLSGTMQDALLYVPVDSEPVLFVKRELSRAKKESPLDYIIPIRSIKEIRDHIKPMKRVGLQLDVTPYNDIVKFKELLGKADIFDSSFFSKELRKDKSPFEISLMEKAGSIAKKVYEHVPDLLREGISEIELAGQMEAFAKPLGHEGLLRARSFNWEAYTWHILSGRTGSIVSQSDSPMGGLGMSPAFPVGASLRKVKKNEPILIDFGICYHGYQVDETRMFAIGSMPDFIVKAYNVCKDIHYRILDKALEGTTSKELFQYSVELAGKAGYADYYLGYKKNQVRFLAHGIGIEIAESPYIAASHTYPIEDGACIAIEPKMVFPGRGACGIENTVVFENGTYRILTGMDENIIIV